MIAQAIPDKLASICNEDSEPKLDENVNSPDYRYQRELNNRIRREQESDYQRSLAADRERLKERKRIESERKLAEKNEREKRKREQEKKEVCFPLLKCPDMAASSCFSGMSESTVSREFFSLPVYLFLISSADLSRWFEFRECCSVLRFVILFRG
ncbi:unnamed protein product [Gongylonema pulchrum]|uniref:CCDC50_N domain-containing protein n=1 Tax=Gongylonema pulchrum TaxID=637853 RepID=A0A183DKU7_9BILA|nr:unnamed protein product [Gongylonema pulchrum]